MTGATKDGVAAQYTYDGDGFRQTKRVSGVTKTHVWDGDEIAIELDSAVTKYVRGINLICREDAQGQRYYYLYNGHGDVVQIADSSGNVVNSYQYDEWGNTVQKTEQVENPFEYVGQYWDEQGRRIPQLADMLGVKVSQFSKTVDGFINFTEQTQRVIREGAVNDVGKGKVYYYLQTDSELQTGVVVIVHNGKLQSMMPSNQKYFETRAN